MRHWKLNLNLIARLPLCHVDECGESNCVVREGVLKADFLPQADKLLG